MSITQARMVESGALARVGEDRAAARVTEDYTPAGGFLRYRTFDGVDDEIVTAVAETNGTGIRNKTWAFYMRPLSLSVDAELLSTSDYSPWAYFFQGSQDKMMAYDGTTAFSSAESTITTTGWYVVAVTVSSTGVIEFHHWVQATDTWTHSGPVGTTSSAAFGSGDDFHHCGPSPHLNADLVCGAVWHSELSDTDIETLTDSFAAWSALSPTHLWRYDETPVNDHAGSSDQTAITGTIVSSTDSPLPEGPPPVTEVTMGNATFNASATSGVLDKPAGAVVDEDRYVISVFDMGDQVAPTFACTDFTPHGAVQQTSDGSGRWNVQTLSKKCSGSEGSTFTVTGIGSWCYLFCYVAKGAGDRAPQIGTFANAPNATGDVTIPGLTATDDASLSVLHHADWDSSQTVTAPGYTPVAGTLGASNLLSKPVDAGATGNITVDRSPGVNRNAGYMVVWPPAGPAIISDDFNRADGTLGPEWAARGSASVADYFISSNKVACYTGLDSLLQWATPITWLDGWVEMSLRQDDGYQGLQTMITTPFRREVAIVIYPGNPGTFQLERRDGGSMDTYSGYIPGTEVTVRLEWNITPGVTADYRGYINGVLQLEGTLTAAEHTASTFHVGFGTYKMSGVTTFDNFRCGPLPYTPP